MSKRRVVSNAPPRDRAALVSLVTRQSRALDSDDILDELTGLARAAGADVVLSVAQSRGVPDSSTLIGTGKAESLAESAREAGATVIIFDNDLTPGQARNLERVCGRRVIDRTELILDIFAQRARTKEGQLQVELAQLQYLLPRLAGSSDALSRLGGGIGTRGPGETKLETDRRRIRHRIAGLKAEIGIVRRRRGYLRDRRKRTNLPTVALVGYTNAGKTTLFNLLTGAAAAASHALFVTLDPLLRRVKLGDARQILISDTVGFIDRLPHQLVAAFHATLEEVAAADLLVHVIDASAPDRARRAEAVRSVLSDVGADRLPTIDVFNKIDLLAEGEAERLRATHAGAVMLSAQRGTGREHLLDVIAARLAMDAQRMTLQLDRSVEADRKLLASLYRHARVVRVDEGAGAEQLSIEADVPRRLMSRFRRAKVPA
ncbi:MAG TPA: GTPase HflX [Vicinamibacterales bacterium]|nr:GTPase HflX [Vicinamibacterales bacterium]